MSHWLGPASCHSCEVPKSKKKFGAVIGKHVCVGNYLQFKLGGKDLGFDSSGTETFTAGVWMVTGGQACLLVR